MATATAKYTDRVIVLELSEAEAEMLTDVLHNVGGDPVSSPRRHANAVNRELVKLGVKHTPSNCATGGIEGSIFFKTRL